MINEFRIDYNLPSPLNSEDAKFLIQNIFTHMKELFTEIKITVNDFSIKEDKWVIKTQLNSTLKNIINILKIKRGSESERENLLSECSQKLESLIKSNAELQEKSNFYLSKFEKSLDELLVLKQNCENLTLENQVKNNEIQQLTLKNYELSKTQENNEENIKKYEKLLNEANKKIKIIEHNKIEENPENLEIHSQIIELQYKNEELLEKINKQHLEFNEIILKQYLKNEELSNKLSEISAENIILSQKLQTQAEKSKNLISENSIISMNSYDFIAKSQSQIFENYFSKFYGFYIAEHIKKQKINSSKCKFNFEDKNTEFSKENIFEHLLNNCAFSTDTDFLAKILENLSEILTNLQEISRKNRNQLFVYKISDKALIEKILYFAKMHEIHKSEFQKISFEIIFINNEEDFKKNYKNKLSVF